jgi:hypothetical protein
MPKQSPRATRSKVKPGRALARPGDPLVTGDGKIVEPEGFHNGKESASGVDREKQTINPAMFRPAKRRNMNELPAERQLMNAIGVVFMLTVMGVGDREIADNLKTTVEEVNWIRHHAAYNECFNNVISEFVNANSELLAARIAAYADGALKTVGELATHGKKEETKLRASQDILDRAGVRPKDVAERAIVKNDLRIIIIEGDDDKGKTFEVSMEQEIS